MPHQVKNTELVLASIIKSVSNYTCSNIEILSAESVITPEFVSLPLVWQWIGCGFGWVTVIVLTYFRCIIYKYFFNQYKAKELTPINVLTLVVCLFQHIFVIIFQTHDTLIVSFGISLQDIICSTWACIPLRIVNSFEQFYSVIGSLGIAIYRILLIKHNDFVKYTIGQKSLMTIVLCCGLVFTALLSFPAIHLLEPLRPKCMLLPKYNILQLLDDYGQSVGNAPVNSLMMKLRVSSWLVMMFFSATELGIYVAIFYFLYKHDNSENLRRILDYQCIKARNKKNAVTFFAQFCSFVTKLVFMIFCVNALRFGKSNNFVYYVLTILKKTCLCSMAVIEVVASSTLRSRVLN